MSIDPETLREVQLWRELVTEEQRKTVGKYGLTTIAQADLEALKSQLPTPPASTLDPFNPASVDPNGVAPASESTAWFS